MDQATLPFDEEQTVAAALEWVERTCADLVGSHLPALLDGTVTIRAQDHSLATYCSQRSPEDAAISWAPDVRLSDGRKLRIWRTRVDLRQWLGPPGAVVERGSDEVVVTCGQGAVVLLETQLDEQPAQPPADILPDRNVRLG